MIYNDSENIKDLHENGRKEKRVQDHVEGKNTLHLLQWKKTHRKTKRNQGKTTHDETIEGIIKIKPKVRKNGRAGMLSAGKKRKNFGWNRGISKVKSKEGSLL